MSPLTRAVRGRIALLTAVSLLVSQNAGLVLAQTPAAKPAPRSPRRRGRGRPTPPTPRSPIDGG